MNSLLALVPTWYFLLGNLINSVVATGEFLKVQEVNTRDVLKNNPNFTHVNRNGDYIEEEHLNNLDVLKNNNNYTHVERRDAYGDYLEELTETFEPTSCKSCNSKFHHRRPGLPKVLILHPIYAGSHELTLRKLGESLVEERGWSVTQVRWRSTKTREVNSTVEVITLSPDNRDNRYPYMSEEGTFHPPTSMLWERPRQLWQVPVDVFGLMDAHCQTLLRDNGLIQRLRWENFTVAVVDVIANECSLALAHHLGIPTIGFWGFSLQGGEARAAGMFQSPAIVPTILSEVGANMNFRERLWNMIMTLGEMALVNYHYTRIDYNVRDTIPGTPSSKDLLQSMEAVLVHSKWFIDYPKLLPPHISYVGCFSCGPPKPLPPHLENWMSGSGEAGVIVFSLGFTGYEASTVPKNVMKAFLDAFSQLKQRVILRFSESELPAIPSNVMVVDWFPQHDLLGDERTRLFISHCGQTGINEAIYHGVPIVGVPIFADQGDNARRLLDQGLGVILDKSSLNKEIVLNKLLTVLNNSSYGEQAKRYSSMWQDEQYTGVDIAATWIERVHRYGPLKHLRMPGAKLWLYEYFGLDTAFALLIISTFPCLLFFLICGIFRKRKIQKAKLD